MHKIQKSNYSIVFGCVVDQQPKYLHQALYLICSLRWFGGEVCDAPFFLCSVGEIPKKYLEFFNELNVDIFYAKSFEMSYPHTNKLRFLQLSELRNFNLVVLLDCDVLIVQDPSTHLSKKNFAAKIVDTPTISNFQFEKLFNQYNIKHPQKDNFCELTNSYIYPYFNSGVCVFPKNIFLPLSKAWIKWTKVLIENSQKLDFPRFFIDQIGLTLAIAEIDLPYEILPTAMNFPIHLPLSKYTEAYKYIDPVIIHHHNLLLNGASQIGLINADIRLREFNSIFAQSIFAA